MARPAFDGVDALYRSGRKRVAAEPIDRLGGKGDNLVAPQKRPRLRQRLVGDRQHHRPLLSRTCISLPAKIVRSDDCASERAIIESRHHGVLLPLLWKRTNL